jgi:hypothetical protein
MGTRGTRNEIQPLPFRAFGLVRVAQLHKARSAAQLVLALDTSLSFDVMDGSGSEHQMIRVLSRLKNLGKVWMPHVFRGVRDLGEFRCGVLEEGKNEEEWEGRPSA